MTKNISLFQLLGVEKVEDFDFTKLWAASKVEKSMGVPLGVRTKNDIVYLDLHEKYHGPHGLVAGTTGSGKSEILQSYILSMAVHFHPHEVGFLIIDFKGGGMVNQFRDLPHLLGAITNMEGREVERSLKSIKAELLRRQSLFADADVNHIDAYILAHKKDPARVPVPLPHLIMIVDEFAELKSEHGDFMKELISAARIGRSLGVHLILATQKPSGVVDDQIWSNSKFKLCLKVQTREDSNEVLKTPLAAEIREPGRAYLQVGNNEILELFQSAYSGAKIHRDKDARAKFSISELNLWGKGKTVYRTVENKSDQGEQITELQALVDAINEHCRQAGIHRLATICMEPLADELLLSDIAVQKPADPQRVYAAVGIYDDPERMTQAPLLVDVTESNLFLLGSSQTGKTVFVQTMVASLARLYTPRDVNIYIIDGGNSIPKTFEQSGIIGGICYREEEERMGNLLNMLSTEFENRRRKFVQASVGNYRSYLASGYSDLPHILVILDNAVAFKEFCTEIYEELIAMSREGLGLGVYFIVTSTQYSVLSPKIMIGFGTRLALNCNDTSEYSNLFDRCRMEPKNTPGRGLVQMEKRILEFQTAWSANGKNEQERNENIVAAFLKRNQSYGGMAARPIPMVPDILPANEFYASFKPKTPYAIPIGISYNTVEPVLLPLLEYSMLPVIGRSRSGRTNFIRQVLGAIQRTTLLNRTRCYIIDSMQQPLESCSKNYGFVAGYTVNAQDAPGILQEVVQELEKRQQYLVENRQKGREEDLLKDLPLLLVVAENPDFIAEMSRDKETVQLINAFLKLNRYKALILINNVENVSFTGMSSPELGKRLRDAKQAILMEDLANWRIFDASPKLLRQYPKPLRQGDAYLYSQGVVTDKIRTIFMNE